MTELPLAGQAALITGGATRLGRAIALGLAARGANIALHFHSASEDAQKTAFEIRALGRVCQVVQADLMLVESPAKIFQAILPALGHIDVLINSAAVFDRGTFAETTPELWERLLALNVRSAYFLAQSFARQTRHGSIVNIADWRGERPDPEYLVYSVSKSALITLTRGMALSLAPGIRVNAVAPGAILPPPGADPEYTERIKRKIPLHRLGSPSDVVDAVVFLLTSPFITGEVLHVTGGQSL
jgi:pteridine reductase